MTDETVKQESDGRWSYTTPNGEKQFYNSQTEAQAAANSQGGSAERQPKQPGVTGTQNIGTQNTDQGRTGGKR